MNVSQHVILNRHITLKEETFAVLRFLAEFAKVNSRKKLGKLSTAKVYSRKKFEIYQQQKKSIFSQLYLLRMDFFFIFQL